MQLAQVEHEVVVEVAVEVFVKLRSLSKYLVWSIKVDVQAEKE
jgi:hypothetical protein